jgi:hypothetical protein
MCLVAAHVVSHVVFTACYITSVGGCAAFPSIALPASRRVEGKRTEQIPNGANLCFSFVVAEKSKLAGWREGLSEQISRVADGSKTIRGAAKSRHVDIQKQFGTSL